MAEGRLRVLRTGHWKRKGLKSVCWHRDYETTHYSSIPIIHLTQRLWHHLLPSCYTAINTDIMKPPLPSLHLVSQVPPCSLLSQLHHHLPISIPAPSLMLPKGREGPMCWGRGERQKKPIQFWDGHKLLRVNSNADYSSLGMVGLGHCCLLLLPLLWASVWKQMLHGLRGRRLPVLTQAKSITAANKMPEGNWGQLSFFPSEEPEVSD